METVDFTLTQTRQVYFRSYFAAVVLFLIPRRRPTRDNIDEKQKQNTSLR